MFEIAAARWETLSSITVTDKRTSRFYRRFVRRGLKIFAQTVGVALYNVLLPCSKFSPKDEIVPIERRCALNTLNPSAWTTTSLFGNRDVAGER